MLLPVRVAKCPPVLERAVLWFTVRVFCKSLSNFVCAFFSSGFVWGWDLIVLIPDH